MEYLYSNVLMLAQTEIERTAANQQIINDFYVATYSLESTPVADFNT